MQLNCTIFTSFTGINRCLQPTWYFGNKTSAYICKLVEVDDADVVANYKAHRLWQPIMKTVAILSRKGGAGKTTIALHLAVAVEKLGVSTAVFDLDPQASACLWSDHRQEQFPAVVPAQAPRLSGLLAQARTKAAGLVILDTAPHADSIASEAANHADTILIPCRPSSLDLDAIGATIRLARATNKPCYVVINAAPPQGVETQEAQNGLTNAGVELSPVVLHQRKAFASWMHEGRTAQEMDPTCKAATEINDLTKWLCNKMMLLPTKASNNRHKSVRSL